MSRDKVINLIGLALLGICFLFALIQVFSRVARDYDGDTITIKFAHWQLESGVREALDAVVKDFEALKAREIAAQLRAEIAAAEQSGGLSAFELKAKQKRLARIESGKLKPVRVMQAPIPEKVFDAWLKTRLVGGMAPHAIAMGKGTNDEVTAEFFEPISDIIEEPNPYNAGTELEGVPWRNTIYGGLETSGFSENLMENYGVPVTVLTVRFFYNEDLLAEVLEQPENLDFANKLSQSGGVPANYVDFIELCERIRAFATKTGRQLSPIAGSNYNAPALMRQIFRSQTQRMRVDEDKIGDHSTVEWLYALDLIRGEKRLDNPAFRSGMELMREVAQHMNPGFIQLAREDAMFRFIQGKCAMIATGAWDAPSLKAQAGDVFKIGVMALPVPTRAHPKYGKNVLGSITESDSNPIMTFGLVNYYPEEERQLVIDFLRYLTSVEGNQKFSNLSGWLPANVSSKPNKALEVYLPEREGYPRGFDLELTRGEVGRILENKLFVLLDSDGSVDAFIEQTEALMLEAIHRNVEKNIANKRKVFRRQDTLLAVRRVLHQDSGDLDEQVAIGMLMDAQQSLEPVNHYYEQRLAEIDSK